MAQLPNAARALSTSQTSSLARAQRADAWRARPRRSETLGVSGEEELAQRAKAGDRSAFSALMGLHKHGLYRFVRRRTANPEDAYDVLQEAFVSAWLALERYDPKRPLEAWLRVIALNKCRDHARRRAVRRAVSGAAPGGGAAEAPDTAPSPEEEIIARSEFDRAQRALEALPHHLREALVLTAVEGFSQAEAGEVLGCTAKAVEYRVARARSMLAARMMDEG
ncbi:MAG: RNA polymerase sigma factor [Hydrogenophilaceae bacterium]|nr:RNA polymerase sigma factor [Hydrogenophilaceae bacterium]